MQELLVYDQDDSWEVRKMQEKEKTLMGIVAQGWCTTDNQSKVMDPILVCAISKKVMQWHNEECRKCKKK